MLAARINMPCNEQVKREAPTLTENPTGTSQALPSPKKTSRSAALPAASSTVVKGDKSGRSLEAFLNVLLNGPSGEWKKVVTAGDVLRRRLAAVNAFDKLETLGWDRRTGGYQIPAGKSLP